MKIFYFLFTFLVCMFSFQLSFAQDEPDLTGVWTGHLYNDTTQKFIPFEIAISKHNGKLAGYTYTVFMIDSVANIGVKAVTIKEKNGAITIKDKKLIDDNYKDGPDKGVYTTLELQPSQNDTADILSGRWFTNRTKQFYPLTGTVSVSKRRNIFATRIVPKLVKLGLADELSFYNKGNYDKTATVNKPREEISQQEKDTMMTIMEPELVISVKKDDTKAVKLPGADDLRKIIDSAKGSAPRKPDVTENVTTTKSNEQLSEKNPAPEITRPKEQVPRKEIVKNEGVPATILLKPQPPPSHETPAPIVKKDTVAAKPVIQTPKYDISKRVIETIRTVKVDNDSLVLSLFDNGAVDGDTVSVFLNGKLIMSRVGLLTTAFNKTIHLTSEMGDSIKIILYAENLGSIPPNTGLLVVRDGDKDYEIRFSGDLQKNSAIILLRNKQE